MGNCKCQNRARIVSDVVRSIPRNCIDVCSHPICGEPSTLGLMAPVIYDEIGINLCGTIALDVDFVTTYPTAVSATVSVLDIAYTYGTEGVVIEALADRPNCFVIRLSNLTVQFVMNLYDANCRLVGTIYPTGLYLPSDITAPTYDEDTNPTSVELEIFAPYGLSYNSVAGDITAAISYIGKLSTNNMVRQGVNLYGMAKLLDLDTETASATIGLTLVLQSLYYVGYKVKSEGRIDVPKGSIIAPDNEDCMKFVAGDLLNLEIKPLDLGTPCYGESLKNECKSNICQVGDCESITTDNTEVI